MILSNISQSDRYAALHPLFPRAFEYIRNTDLFALTPGRYHIVGDDLIAIVEHAPGKHAMWPSWKCIGVTSIFSWCLDGIEEMGWKPLADCYNPVSEHSMEKDIRFFHDAAASWIVVPPDHFCIFFPEDAHAPLVATQLRRVTADRGSNGQAAPPQQGGYIRKVIFKIAVEPEQP